MERGWDRGCWPSLHMEMVLAVSGPEFNFYAIEEKTQMLLSPIEESLKVKFTCVMRKSVEDKVKRKCSELPM